MNARETDLYHQLEDAIVAKKPIHDIIKRYSQESTAIHAQVAWTELDIISEAIDCLGLELTDEQAHAFLEEHAKYLSEAMVQEGFKVIRDFLPDFVAELKGK